MIAKKGQTLMFLEFFFDDKWKRKGRKVIVWWNISSQSEFQERSINRGSMEKLICDRVKRKFAVSLKEKWKQL